MDQVSGHLAFGVQSGTSATCFSTVPIAEWSSRGMLRFIFQKIDKRSGTSRVCPFVEEPQGRRGLLCKRIGIAAYFGNVWDAYAYAVYRLCNITELSSLLPLLGFKGIFLKVGESAAVCVASDPSFASG